MPRRTKYIGPIIEYCLNNNEYLHTHVIMIWVDKKNPKYELQDAFNKTPGVACSYKAFPYRKGKIFLDKVRDKLNEHDNEYFKKEKIIEV